MLGQLVHLVVGDLAELAPPPPEQEVGACGASASSASSATTKQEEQLCPYQFARTPPRVGKAMFGARMAPDSNVGFETLRNSPAASAQP